jgi:drug/metabolite transporter (DMT)-like permease
LSTGPDSRWLALMPALFVLIWSTGFVVARLGMPHAPPFGFLIVRFALSALAFGAWIALVRAPWPATASQWKHLAISGILMHAGYLGGVWFAIKHGLGAGLAALIVGLQPLVTALWLSAAAGDGRSTVSARQWLGLLLGLVGLVLVVWNKLGLGEAGALTVASATLALASITIGTLYQKRHVQPHDVRTANAVQILAAFVVTLPLALWEYAQGERIDPQPAFVAALAWSVLVLTLGGSSLLFLLIQRGAATTVTSLLYLVPPCTAVMAWAMFDEQLGGIVLGGFALAALGVALVVREPSKPAVHPPAPGTG